MGELKLMWWFKTFYVLSMGLLSECYLIGQWSTTYNLATFKSRVNKHFLSKQSAKLRNLTLDHDFLSSVIAVKR